MYLNLLKFNELTFFGLFTGGDELRSDWINNDVMAHILSALMVENRLAIVVSLTTGLRIDDVLSLKTAQLSERITVTESKTKKRRTIRLSNSLLDELLKISGKIWVFEGRCDARKHRTRQAVYKDIKRACKAFRVPSTLKVSPHTARKMYAVKQYKRTCSMEKVQSLLNHSSEAVTMIYALADELTRRNSTSRENEYIKPDGEKRPAKK